jgi:hypothetical protein
MLKRILLLVVFVLAFMFNANAQLNESFDNLAYGVPNGWDNSSYDASVRAWSYYTTGLSGHAVAFEAVDVPNKAYAVLKTPMLSNLPAGCMLSFNVNAPGQMAQMSVSLEYGAKEVPLGKLMTKGWTEMVYDLSAYAGYSIRICFKVDCGGKG